MRAGLMWVLTRPTFGTVHPACMGLGMISPENGNSNSAEPFPNKIQYLAAASYSESYICHATHAKHFSKSWAPSRWCKIPDFPQPSSQWSTEAWVKSEA